MGRGFESLLSNWLKNSAFHEGVEKMCFERKKKERKYALRISDIKTGD